MLVRFRGVYGALLSSRRHSLDSRRNTPCVEIRDDQKNAVLVLDAGSGIIGLASSLGAETTNLAIVLSHYHRDHVEGLRSFLTLLPPGTTVSIWAPELDAADQRDVEAVFVVAGERDIRWLRAGEAQIGGFQVLAAPLNHPGGAFAYRIQGSAGDLVYASDHEFGDVDADETLATFALNSAATVLDAHFTPEELASSVGSGHASWRQSAEFASATGAGHLWLFHHHPERTDGELDAIEARARRVYPATRVAREGDCFLL